jgi:hypothetical protein
VGRVNVALSFPDIEVSTVVTTGGTQSRAELSEAVVAEYASAMQEGAAFPPIVVFHDGSAYWLADGFHRVMAATRAGVQWLTADIRKGTKRDAVLYSVSANAVHGLPRTNADKRHAVNLLLNDPEWTLWSNREIARHCQVHHTFVDKVRHQLSADNRQMPAERKVERNGTVYTQHTENIGKSRKPAELRSVEVAALARLGNRASQIADKIGVSEQQVRAIARTEGIELPDKDIGKVRRVDNRRVVEQTVYGIDGAAQSLKTIGYSMDGITPAEAAEWAEMVADALRIYRAFHKQLTEAANG